MMVDLLAFDVVADTDSNLMQLLPSLEASLASDLNDSWYDVFLGDDEIAIIGGNSTYVSAGLEERKNVLCFL